MESQTTQKQCFVSIALNVGLVTKYAQIGHTDMCIPSMSMGDLQ